MACSIEKRSLNMSKEELLRCPKCSDRLIPRLLDTTKGGLQKIWWTCASNEDSASFCAFPFDMPPEVFWVTRCPSEIEKNVIPEPNFEKLPKRFLQRYYPSLLRSSSRQSEESGRGYIMKTKNKKSRSRSDGVSVGTSDSGLLANSDISKPAEQSLQAISSDAVMSPTGTDADVYSACPPTPDLDDCPQSPDDSDAASSQGSISGCVAVASTSGSSTYSQRLLTYSSKRSHSKDPDSPPSKRRVFRPFQDSSAPSAPRPNIITHIKVMPPSPFVCTTVEPMEKLKAAISIMHSKSGERPSDVELRKVGLNSGYMKKVDSWNRSAIFEAIEEDCKTLRKAGQRILAGYEPKRVQPAPTDETLERIEMNEARTVVDRLLTAKAQQRHGMPEEAQQYLDQPRVQVEQFYPTQYAAPQSPYQNMQPPPDAYAYEVPPQDQPRQIASTEAYGHYFDDAQQQVDWTGQARAVSEFGYGDDWYDTDQFIDYTGAEPGPGDTTYMMPAEPTQSEMPPEAEVSDPLNLDIWP
ncbi:unnamed protein product, partial [Mesorhabditis spiculigera]